MRFECQGTRVGATLKRIKLSISIPPPLSVVHSRLLNKISSILLLAVGKLKLKKIKNLLLQIDKMKEKYAKAEYDVDVMLKHSFQFLPSFLPPISQPSQRLFAQFDSLIFLF